MTPRRRVFLLKTIVWLACLTPLGWVAYRWYLGDHLTANPVEALEHWSGLSAFVILTASLAVTPVRRFTGWNDIQKVRRLTGLWAFAYAVVHFGIYLGLDQFFGWSFILEDITERPFIISGTLALLCLLPLALTSTRASIRRLGKNWVRLHRLVYPAAGLALLHFLWGQKADIRNPIIGGVVLGVLLGVRLVWWWRRRRRPPPRREPVAPERETAAVG